MKGFLAQVAEDLYGRYGDEISSLSVLFPSRRAGLFFGEALSKIIARPIWQPDPVTIDGLMEELSGLAVGERLRLVVELYKIYAEYHPQESFDGFYFWGELLLGDFDAIDKYLIDADVLFSNLVDLHELDYRFDYLTPEQRAIIEKFWGTFRGGDKNSKNGDREGGFSAGDSDCGFSAEQADFLRVWRTLAPIYHRFRARLRELGIAYPGMVYREAAERIRDGRAPQIPERQYVIAGFNALSRCEQVLFDFLRQNFRVDFYWDYDNYFISSEIQEAGRFMRDNIRRFPQTSQLSGGHDNFLKHKEIRSVSAASDVLQCKYAGLRVAELIGGDAAETSYKDASNAEKSPKNTAIVLCDETLLTPLLWSMPPQVDKINVTMGYPLRFHPTYSFVERLIELQNRRKTSRNSLVFYHSDVEGLMRNPYVSRSAFGTAPDAQNTDNQPVFRSNYVYLNAAKLRTTPLTERIFVAPEGWREMSDWLIEIINEVAASVTAVSANGAAASAASDATAEAKNTSADSTQNIDIQFFAIIADHIRTLAASLDESEIEIEPKTFATLLRRSLQSVTVPFEGEPLEGVQVMGILETRALDFENVIFLSAGDSNAPGNMAGAPSFIPYNLKMAYGLPTPEHHEGVWAYHFFRLIQRALRVDLVWSQTADDRNTGQPSRYIWQLDYESPHIVEKQSVTVDVNLSPAEPIAVEKDVSMLPRKLSPSTFYSYVECPLKFYFRAVARLRVDEEVSEDVDNALFGNILHLAMQRLYTPLVGVADPRPRIRAMIGSAAVLDAVEAAISELGTKQESVQRDEWGGGMLLIHKTIADYINRAILPYDAALEEPFTIEALEKEIEAEFCFVGQNFRVAEQLSRPLKAGSGRENETLEGYENDGNKVTFRGIADRIDRLNDSTLRVVDYKTGSPKNRDSAIMQMRLYAMMLGEDEMAGRSLLGQNVSCSPPLPKSSDCEFLRNSKEEHGRVQTALYYIRDMSKPDYEPPKIEAESGFEDELRAILGEMFDPAVPFVQCADPAPCAWCDFREICRR